MLQRDGRQWVTDVTADRLLFTEDPEGGGVETIWTLAFEEGAEAQPVVAGPADVRDAVFSPDGRWIAYRSFETGIDEIWIQEFPGPGEKIQVSAGEGAFSPVWNEAGISYNSFGYWMLVEDLDAGPGVEPAAPRQLLREIPRGFNRGTNYSVSTDGTRLLVTRAVDADQSTGQGPTIRIVLNWFDEIRRRAPVER